jgi:hypothetical protein
MQQTGTINDIKQDVIDALQGRTDISDGQIANYVAKSIRELSESSPFPELQQTGPQVSMTIGQAIYPVATFVNTGDTYSMPEVFVIYIDYPMNTVSVQMKYRTPTAIETMIAPAVQGIPAWWTRYASNFHFGPVPQNAFTVFLRYQVKHPFSPVPVLTDPIYMPHSWYDIIAYSAAMRIAVIKRWTDQRKELHDMLFGDPEYINSLGKRGRPGLIAARLFQQERDEAYNSRQMTPVVARVNPR